MKKLFIVCVGVILSLLLALAAQAQTYSGTWIAQPSETSGMVNVELAYEHHAPGDDSRWDESSDVPYAQLHGLSPNDFRSHGMHKGFTLERDAGQFNADGWFANGRGSGGWTFNPSAQFRSELQHRGISGLDQNAQFRLATVNFRLQTLDQLRSAGFALPSVADLVQMSEHGVDERYVAAMRGVPLQPKTVAELISMRDHGVSPEFAAQMMRTDPRLTGEDLIRLRDHGVSPDYLGGLQRLGYHPNPSDLARLVDHGVSIDFIQRLRSHGYTHLSVDDLIRLRDHGF